MTPDYGPQSLIKSNLCCLAGGIFVKKNSKFPSISETMLVMGESKSTNAEIQRMRRELLRREAHLRRMQETLNRLQRRLDGVNAKIKGPAGRRSRTKRA